MPTNILNKESKTTPLTDEITIVVMPEIDAEEGVLSYYNTDFEIETKHGVDYVVALSVTGTYGYEEETNSTIDKKVEVEVEDVRMYIDDEQIDLDDTQQDFLQKQFQQLIKNAI